MKYENPSIRARMRARASTNWIAAVVSLIAFAGCGPSDPLDPIREMHERGDFAGSVEPLRELIQDDYESAELHYRYGRALVATGQSGLAEWALREAMEDPEWLVPAGRQLAVAALADGNLPIALEAASRILEQHPDDAEALLLRARAHAHLRLDPEAALADVERLLVLDPKNLEVQEPRILALLALDRAEEAGQAIEDLGRLIEESSDSASGELAGWHCATAAIFAEESGEEERARDRWEECLERYPGHPNVVSNATNFFDARGEYQRSLELLRAGQRAAPRSRELRALLALRLRDAGQADEAEELLLEATRSGSAQETSAALLDLAKHYQAEERYTEAARALDRAVEIVSEVSQPSASLILEQADARLLAGELDAALAVAERMTVSGHRAMILARVAQEKGEHARALELYDEAFRIWPDNPWARYHAALSAEAVGDFDRALAEYRAALRIDAAATDAGLRGARILLAENKVSEALATVSPQLNNRPSDLEARRIAIRIVARQGRMQQVRNALREAGSSPGALAPAARAAAQGLREGHGSEAALAALQSWQSEGVIDWRKPEQVEILRLLVDLCFEVQELPRAEAAVRDALRANASSASLHAVLGRALALGGADAEQVRRAYARAEELDAELGRALLGLGKLATARDPERARSLLERAAIAADGDWALQPEVARALVAAGASELAAPLFEASLKENPVDGATASDLAALRVADGAETSRTLELAQRGVRFGGGARAYDVLVQVHELRGEADQARVASAQAETLRNDAEASRRN